jgi:transposase-like protein
MSCAAILLGNCPPGVDRAVKGFWIMAQNRHFWKDFKAKVTIGTIKGEKANNEIAPMYEVHPNQISQWKKLAGPQ